MRGTAQFHFAAYSIAGCIQGSVRNAEDQNMYVVGSNPFFHVTAAQGHFARIIRKPGHVRAAQSYLNGTRPQQHREILLVKHHHTWVAERFGRIHSHRHLCLTHANVFDARLALKNSPKFGSEEPF
jgi:hypothetical protein